MSTYWRQMVADAFDRDQSRDEMRVAAVELRQRGLTPADIAAALRLSEAAVRELLERAP
jgi:orotate phosphoribosyltransferase-like protein